MKPLPLIPRSHYRDEGDAPASLRRAGKGGAPGTPEAREQERELVRRAQGGDEQAFRELVDQHGDRAYALALRIVRSASDAEEVAQDALVRAWRSLPRFRGESAFSSWLHRIVVRRAYDRATLLKGRRTRETGVEGIEQLPGPRGGPDPEEWWRAERLERLVAELPEVPRTVVTLYYFQDRSVAEVARILRMPENTVKTHLSRARAALRVRWTAADAPERSGGEGDR